MYDTHYLSCCLCLIWPIQNDEKNLKNDWNPSTWVLIWVLSKHYPMNTNMTGFKWIWAKVTSVLEGLSLPMLRLPSSKAQERYVFWNPFKPCHVGIHWIALTEHSQMSTHMPGFQWFFSFVYIIFYWPN